MEEIKKDDLSNERVLLESDSFNKNKSDKSYGFILSIFIILLVSSVVSSVIINVAPVKEHDHNQYSKIVFADTEPLVRKQIELLSTKVKNGEMTSEEMKVSGEAFSKALVDAVNAISADGTIVIRMDTVLAYDKEKNQDATPLILEFLAKRGFDFK